MFHAHWDILPLAGFGVKGPNAALTHIELAFGRSITRLGAMKAGGVKIAVAPDSFKGSMTALEAANRIERGLKRGIPRVTVRKIPMADGGEGTVSAIVDATGGRRVKRKVRDPLGRKIEAVFGVSGDGKQAVIEMAAASGLDLLRRAERNPLKTSTAGTGELIKAALDLKVERILVGIGGSATNDGGTGMARALGAKFLNARGRPIPEGGGALEKLERIDLSGLDARLKDVRIEVACDVDNPLTGPKGASRVYGPQKGATPEMVKQLDANLGRLARVIKRDLDMSIGRVPGAGAAGGLGAGLMAFLNGELRPGIDIVIDSVQLERRMRGCELVITGEGRMDGQTVFGKTPSGVARVARGLGIPAIAICGCLGEGVEAVHGIGIEAYFSTRTDGADEERRVVEGPPDLEKAAEEVGRLIAVARRL